MTARRVVGRLVSAVGVLFGVTVITFALTFLVPADPARVLAGAQADPATVARIHHQLGLDDPKPVQFLHYLGGLLHGDWGTSYISQQPVLPTILGRFPATLLLAAGAVVVYLLLGTGLGLLGGIRPRSWVARAGRSFAALAIATPSYWLGLVLLYLFAKRWPLFPIAGYGTPAHLVLPALVLGIGGAAYYHNLVASEIRQQMESEYVRTARAKGLAEGDVIRHHALRNAWLPVVTLLGYDFAGLLGGVVLTEGIFAWPGIGQLALQAINQLDVPLIMGTVLFSAGCITGVNLVVDALYGFLDPRLRDA